MLEGKSVAFDLSLFAKVAAEHGIHAVEYVNQFFMDKAKDAKYLGEMKKRAADQGVKSLLIMCDREGNIGDPDAAKEAWQRYYFKGEVPEDLGTAPATHSNKRRLKSPRVG